MISSATKRCVAVRSRTGMVLFSKESYGGLTVVRRRFDKSYTKRESKGGAWQYFDMIGRIVRKTNRVYVDLHRSERGSEFPAHRTARQRRTIVRDVAGASGDVTRHTTLERARKAARRQSQTYARKSTTLSLLLDRNNRGSHLPTSRFVCELRIKYTNVYGTYQE